MRAQGAHHVAQVALRVLPTVLQLERRGNLAQGRAQTAVQGIEAPVARRLALEVLGGDRRAPEDVIVVVIAPVQNLAGDRVVERLGALGLAVFVQQADVGELDASPQRLVALGFGETAAQLGHRLLDALVVHLDALARERLQLGPGGALEQARRLDRGLAKQAVVAVEARQDRARDLRGEIYAAASFGFFCESKNCSSSVEPCSAVVEALPAVTTWVISSK